MDPQAQVVVNALLANKMLVWITLAIYGYVSLCQCLIGSKTGTTHNWMAFFPILNGFHFCRIAGKSGWWFFLMLVPFLNILVLIYLFVEIARARGKHALVGLLLLFPVLNFLIWGYLAFSSSDVSTDDSGKSHSKVVVLLAVLMMLALPAAYLYGPPEIKEKTNAYWEQILTFGKKTVKVPLSDELMLKEDNFYVYKDLEGSEHFVSTREDVPEQYRDQARKVVSTDLGGQFKLMSKEEEGAMLNKVQGAPLPEQLKNAQHEILVYTFDGDEHLQETKEYFVKFNMPYKVLDVMKNPEYASQLKLKLGLDVNKRYDNLLFPVLEIDGQMVERVVDQTDSKGNVVSHSLNTPKINKIFGLRAAFEE